MDILMKNNVCLDPEIKVLENAMHYVLAGKNLKRYYRRGSETVKALDGVDIEIKKGETIAVVGPSGAGKTTLMNILSCLDQPTDGEVFVNGKPVTGMDEDKLAEVRRNSMGFIFQRFYLVPTLTVRENIEMPLIFARKPVDKKFTDEILRTVGLSDRANHLPRELSGGQMQRVAVARALIGKPSIVVADEPTGNLDSKNSNEIISLLESLSKEKDITVIFSTHDMNIAKRCDRIIYILDGKIEREESKGEGEPKLHELME